MSSLCGQLIGWTPSGDGVQYDSGSAPMPDQAFLNRSPFSKPSFPHPHSRPIRSSSQSTRRQHEPGWVARPRNAFIIFRCDYSQIHRRRGRRIRRPPGVPSTDPSLSKRAATAWKQMTAEEKEPYRLRAEQERDEHVRNNPDYRFRPQRHPGSGSKGRYSLLSSPLTSVTDRKMGSSTGYPPPRELSVASSVSSPADSSPSLTAGEPQSDVCGESQCSSSSSTRWIHPIACHVSPSNFGQVQLPVEMMPVGYTASHFNTPSATMTESTCSVSIPPLLFQNGEISMPTTANGTPSSSNTSVCPEVTNLFAPSPFAHCEGYYEMPYEAQQQPSYAEGLWYAPTGPYIEQMAPGSYQAHWHGYAIPDDYSTFLPVL